MSGPIKLGLPDQRFHGFPVGSYRLFQPNLPALGFGLFYFFFALTDWRHLTRKTLFLFFSLLSPFEPMIAAGDKLLCIPVSEDEDAE